jgi:2-keto-4-pentenoate hydratase/2-oxohepta-3-ene-1,7-dioic acid hydratase in catechol pathway
MTLFPVDWLRSVPVVGSHQLFPVRRIYCVGQNYADHAREMGSDPNREPPFFFMKPADAVTVAMPETPLNYPYPTSTQNFHHEVELVLAIGKRGVNVDHRQASDMIYGLSVGIDFTRRDLQKTMKSGGKPWEISKAFDRSAVIAPITPIGSTYVTHGVSQTVTAQGRFDLWLKVNHKTRQEGHTLQMIWSPAEIIEHLSRYFELCPGDLIFTGTPSGVGAVVKDDVIECGANGLGTITICIVGD